MRPHLIRRRAEIAERYSRHERDRHPADYVERGEILADIDAEADRRQWTRAEAYTAIGAAPLSLHDGTLPTAELRDALARLKAVQP